MSASLGSREFAIVVQLLARGLQFGPAREQLLHAGMFPHDFAGAFAVIEKGRIGDLALELARNVRVCARLDGLKSMKL